MSHIKKTRTTRPRADVGSFGFPVYVVKESTLENNFREFTGAFAGHWPNTRVAYSYKTNPLAHVCRTLHKLGADAEVVSGSEMDAALGLGVPGSRIVFNGPWKSDDEIHRAARAGILINLDYFEELERVTALSERSGVRVDVGLRITFEIEGGAWTKFGFSFEAGEVGEALRRIELAKNLRLRAIHSHVRSNVIDIASYERQIRRVVAVWRGIKDAGWPDLDIIDLGSGFPSHVPVIAASRDVAIPKVSDYAAVVGSLLREGGVPEEVTLIVEPGRVLVASAARLLTRVIALKTRNGRDIAIVDAGTNMVPGVPTYEYGVRLLGEGCHGSPTGEYEVHGSLCENLDVLGVCRPPRSLTEGDVLVIDAVGAYDMASRCFAFIRPIPAVVWQSADGVEALVREASPGPNPPVSLLSPESCA